MKLVDMSYDIIKQINEMLYIHEQSTILRTCRTMQEMMTNIYKKSEETCYVNVYMKENKVLVVPLSGCGSTRQYKKTQHHWVQTEDVIAQLTKNKIKKFTLRKCNLTVEYCTMLSELIKIYPLKIDKCDILSSILPNESLSAFGNLLKILQPRVININKLPNIGMAVHKIFPCLDEQFLCFENFLRNYLKMNLLDVNYDVFNLIIKLLHPHEAITLIMTSTKLYNTFHELYQKIESNVGVFIRDNKILIFPLSGNGFQWKKETNELPLEDGINQLPRKKIIKLTLKKTKLTIEYVKLLINFVKDLQLQVERFDIVFCSIPSGSVEEVGILLGTVRARVVYINEIIDIGRHIYRIIPLLDTRTESVSWDFWGGNTLTYYQAYTTDYSDFINGNMIWHRRDLCFAREPERYNEEGWYAFKKEMEDEGLPDPNITSVAAKRNSKHNIFSNYLNIDDKSRMWEEALKARENNLI